MGIENPMYTAGKHGTTYEQLAAEVGARTRECESLITTNLELQGAVRDAGELMIEARDVARTQGEAVKKAADVINELQNALSIQRASAENARAAMIHEDRCRLIWKIAAVTVAAVLIAILLNVFR